MYFLEKRQTICCAGVRQLRILVSLTGVFVNLDLYLIHTFTHIRRLGPVRAPGR